LKLLERRVCDVRVPETDSDRVTISRGLGNARGADTTVRSCYILNDDRLPERIAHAFSEETSDGISSAARREWHNHRDGA
jgi:hypothetical protein